jgi:hypothetical protein
VISFVNDEFCQFLDFVSDGFWTFSVNDFVADGLFVSYGLFQYWTLSEDNFVGDGLWLVLHFMITCNCQ